MFNCMNNKTYTKKIEVSLHTSKTLSFILLYIKIYLSPTKCWYYYRFYTQGVVVMNNFSANFKEMDPVPDSFSAFLVEGAHFSSHEEYPIIEKRMIAQTLPAEIMPFNKAITFRGDLSNTYICTFSPDKTFERIRKNPKKYLNFFKRIAGLIGFDFSIHSDMPLIKQKSQIYDNLALTYYYGNNGIPVIPNVRSGIDELTSELLECIPKYSTITIGTHEFIKEKREKYEWHCFLNEIIDKLHPTNIVVYGPLENRIFDELKMKTNIVCYPSWISNRWRMVHNGN